MAPGLGHFGKLLEAIEAPRHQIEVPISVQHHARDYFIVNRECFFPIVLDVTQNFVVLFPVLLLHINQQEALPL